MPPQTTDPTDENDEWFKNQVNYKFDSTLEPAHWVPMYSERLLNPSLNKDAFFEKYDNLITEGFFSTKETTKLPPQAPRSANPLKKDDPWFSQQPAYIFDDFAAHWVPTVGTTYTGGVEKENVDMRQFADNFETLLDQGYWTAFDEWQPIRAGIQVQIDGEWLPVARVRSGIDEKHITEIQFEDGGIKQFDERLEPIGLRIQTQHQVFVQGQWRNVLEAQTDDSGKVTGLVFEDGGIVHFSEDEQLLVRQIEDTPDPYKVSPADLYGETERLFDLKAMHPEMYDALQLGTISEDNDIFMSAIQWYGDFMAGKTTIEQFPQKLLDPYVEHGADGHPAFVTYKGHKFSIEEIQQVLEQEEVLPEKEKVVDPEKEKVVDEQPRFGGMAGDILDDQRLLDMFASVTETDVDTEVVDPDPEEVEVKQLPTIPEEAEKEETDYELDVEAYLREEHNVEIDFNNITPDAFPYLAFTAAGMPALYGDPSLEMKLGLPDNVRAVQASNGVIHSVWTPPGLSSGMHAKEAGIPIPAK
jgi:hypothetical protein